MKSCFGAALIMAVSSASYGHDDYIHGYLDKHHSEPKIYAVFQQDLDEVDEYEAIHDPYHPHKPHWEPLETHSPGMADYLEHHYHDIGHDEYDHDYDYEDYQYSNEEEQKGYGY